MRTINANELKSRGISVVGDDDETLVTVRGKPAYVIMSIDQYEEVTRADLMLALKEEEEDYQAGRYKTGSVDAHIKRIMEDE